MFETPGEARDVTVTGTHALVADGDAGLEVFDTTVSSPLVGSADTPGDGNHVAINGDNAYLADGTGGHVFASTLKEHNENVKRWRAIEKRLKEEAKEAARKEAEKKAAEAAAGTTVDATSEDSSN